MTSDVAGKIWDVIVIGTGIGGGTIGRRLAEKGLSVLFLEKGPMGPRAEQQSLRSDVEDAAARNIRGYWPTQISARIDDRESLFFGPVGSGAGGSSAFYAATLERPERHDLETTDGRAHPTGGWPVGFDSFVPYFSDAERLYHVCGTDDPLSREAASDLRQPPALTAGDRTMMENFERSGLHPYQIHMAVRFLPGCQMCFGRKCPRPCKMDGRSAGVEPALETGNAAILDNCEVNALRGSASEIQYVDAVRNGEALRLRARRYVLAAGGLGSPRVLLNSKSADWPEGCANSSGLVGRNLMFHLTEMIAIWPGRHVSFAGPSRALAMRDFYFDKGRRFGSLQAMGVDAAYGEIVHYLKNIFDRSPLRNIRPLRGMLRIPAFLAARVFGKAKVFAGIVEDLPYTFNRVLLDPVDPARIRFTYTVTPELQERRRAFRKLIKRKLRGNRSVFLTFRPELNFAHSCGTLRFGDDPSTSILDRNCRAHDVGNLYVVDASFMPTSLGINPSLTIAANALRVADRLAEDIAATEALVTA
ncbi:choline dehydrogenase-like flavoprotein [Rhizobium sp. PP-F2F-G48]|uniref:GMC oxidoreductase n=1 Tax=Rhizobium sp. PP-F2F-G48 TaxID=2135651 RepID=UPI001048F7E7|nr:GMC family oxidoreductase [Rhizobium sp. PP-F2F-G48]TCM49675.1 choline dehydrogenase-like flavoprotein [Rhizobium sp. PP-F2F-G48]